MGAQLLSCVCLFATLWTIAWQAPLSMGFSRQECGSGLSFLPPEDLLTQGSNQSLLWLNHQQVSSLPLSHLGGWIKLQGGFRAKGVVPEEATAEAAVAGMAQSQHNLSDRGGGW